MDTESGVIEIKFNEGGIRGVALGALECFRMLWVCPFHKQVSVFLSLYLLSGLKNPCFGSFFN